MLEPDMATFLERLERGKRVARAASEATHTFRRIRTNKFITIMVAFESDLLASWISGGRLIWRSEGRGMNFHW